MASIAQELNNLGFASVLAVTGKDNRSDASQLRHHFKKEPNSQFGSASLAASSADPKRPTAVDSARVYPNLGIVYGTVDRSGLAALKADPRVSSVKPAPQLSLIRPVAGAGVVGKDVWGIDALGVRELWDQGLSGEGIRVAHLDTGIDATHPALRKALAKFTEIDDSGRELPGAGPRESDDVLGHGTHTAATLAGRAVAGRKVGVAPKAELYSAMVIEGGDTVARVLGGMNWAIGEGVRVLSMSLGIRGLITDFLDVIGVLRDSGVLPVIAVGNEGPGTSRSPGNYPLALSVGAHDSAKHIWDQSSSQQFVRRSQPLVPDVVAPGVDVVSAQSGGGWHTLSGTSMATPHVAGLAALLLQAKPETTVAKLEKAIFASARLGTIDKNRGGRGAVDARRALAALLK